jgi:PST family polysaccharide transporter
MQSLFTRIGALQALGGATFFVRTKVGALLLGPTGIGLVSVVDQFVYLILQLSAFAIPFAAIKVLSKAHSESAKAFKATYAVLEQLLLVTGSLGAMFGMAFIFIRPNWIGTTLAAHTPLVVLGLLALPATILHGFFRNVPASAMRPVITAVWDVITPAIMAVTVIVGILLFGVPGYFAGALVGAVMVSVSYHLYLARRLGLSLKGRVSSVGSFLRSNPSFVELSLNSYIVSFVTPLGLLIVRATILENFGEATAGVLQAAIGISLAVNLVLNPLNGLLLLPLVNRTLIHSKKHQETEAFQKKLLLAIAVVTLPPILFPDLAVIVLYSSKFIEAADALYWFVLGQAMMQIFGIYAALMIGLNRLRPFAIVTLVGTGANAVLAILLVPPLGLLGAGIASFTSASLLALGTFGYLRAREGFAIGRPVGLSTLLLFLGIGLAGAFVGTRSSLDVPNLIVKALICAAALGFAVPISLDHNERRALLARLGSALRRGW